MTSSCDQDVYFLVSFTIVWKIILLCPCLKVTYFASSNISKVQKAINTCKQFLFNGCHASILKWIYLCQLFIVIYLSVCILDFQMLLRQKVTHQYHSRVRGLKNVTKCIDLIWLLIRINQLKKLF